MDVYIYIFVYHSHYTTLSNCSNTILSIESTSSIMNFNARGGISILGLGTYGPALILAIFVCSRHGFGRASGWVYTLILCLVRVIGACCQLATYHSQSAGLLQATIILDTIGLAPLLLATLGLLSRS